MLSRRPLLPAVLMVMAVSLMAQAPQERIQVGFKSLSTGNWESALKEWTRDGIWMDAEGKLQARLEGAITVPRSVGHWEACNLPYLTALWQRHWMMATFDQGVVFFVFDYARHKGQWRLVSLQATQEPREVLPHVDLLPASLAARKID